MRHPSGSRASAYARSCAWKSRLLSRIDAAPLKMAADPAAMQRALTALGFEHPYERLLRIYGMALRAYPDAAPLLRSLLRLHEIENLKLLWRVTVRGRARAALQRLWLPLGTLATIPARIAEVRSLRELTERLAATPFGSIASDVARSFGDDLGAAELAFDRWASLQLLGAARRLPPGEVIARRLIELVARERDSEILRRGTKWYGLSDAAARAATSRDPSHRLRGEGGRRPDEGAADIREQRLLLCRRAFVGDPFAVAPAVALVLRAEEEMRGVRALIERQGDASLDAAARRATAGTEFAT